MIRRQGEIIIPEGVQVWPHELRVARILAKAGHVVEFLPTRSVKTADVLVDGVEYEIKSPERFNLNTLGHTIRDAIKQSPHIIIDTHRMKKVDYCRMQQFLRKQIYDDGRIKSLLMITKRAEIVDIMTLI